MGSVNDISNSGDRNWKHFVPPGLGTKTVLNKGKLLIFMED